MAVAHPVGPVPTWAVPRRFPRLRAMSLVVVLLVVGGLVALVGGGELLVRGASSAAAALGVPPLVVGLTVVALATSAPEMAVTVDAALSGSPGLALGNVVGSNTTNVLLVLGVTAVLAPITVGSQLVRADLPVLIAVSVLALLLALDGSISFGDGLVLAAAAAASTTLSVVLGRRAHRAAAGDEEERPESGSRVRDVLLVLGGVVLLVVGARWLVDGATTIAQALGVSDLVIGLTVVAVGTSLPELATSVIAALRGQLDLAVGNITGSCVLNLGAVLGAAALLAPGGVPVPAQAIGLDLPVMVATVVLLLPLALTGAVVSRPEGAVLVVLYAVYTTYLFLGAASSPAADPFRSVVLLVAVPVVVVWLVVQVVQVVRSRRAGAAGASSRASS